MPGPGFISGKPWFKDGKPVFGSGVGCVQSNTSCRDPNGNLYPDNIRVNFTQAGDNTYTQSTPDVYFNEGLTTLDISGVPFPSGSKNFSYAENKTVKFPTNSGTHRHSMFADWELGDIGPLSGWFFVGSVSIAQPSNIFTYGHPLTAGPIICSSGPIGGHTFVGEAVFLFSPCNIWEPNGPGTGNWHTRPVGASGNPGSYLLWGSASIQDSSGYTGSSGGPGSVPCSCPSGEPLEDCASRDSTPSFSWSSFSRGSWPVEVTADEVNTLDDTNPDEGCQSFSGSAISFRCADYGSELPARPGGAYQCHPKDYRNIYPIIGVDTRNFRQANCTWSF